VNKRRRLGVGAELKIARVAGANHGLAFPPVMNFTSRVEIGGCADEGTAALPRLLTWGDDELASPPMADEDEDGWALSDSGFTGEPELLGPSSGRPRSSDLHRRRPSANVFPEARLLSPNDCFAALDDCLAAFGELGGLSSEAPPRRFDPMVLASGSQHAQGHATLVAAAARSMPSNADSEHRQRRTQSYPGSPSLSMAALSIHSRPSTPAHSRPATPAHSSSSTPVPTPPGSPGPIRSVSRSNAGDGSNYKDNDGCWITRLSDMPIVELNAFIKQVQMGKKDAADLKKVRRQRKNILYTKRSRERRLLSKSPKLSRR
jgi:hypothetical protein